MPWGKQGEDAANASRRSFQVCSHLSGKGGLSGGEILLDGDVPCRSPLQKERLYRRDRTPIWTTAAATRRGDQEAVIRFMERHVIGEGGRTINSIRSSSGADVQVEQYAGEGTSTQRKMVIQGSEEDCLHARKLAHEREGLIREEP